MIALSIFLSGVKENFNSGKRHQVDGKINYLQMKGDTK